MLQGTYTYKPAYWQTSCTLKDRDEAYERACYEPFGGYSAGEFSKQLYSYSGQLSGQGSSLQGDAGTRMDTDPTHQGLLLKPSRLAKSEVRNTS